MTRHDMARSSVRLGSRSGSARGSAYWSSGIRSPRLGLARLDSARLGSARLGSEPGSARLGWLLGVRLISTFGSGSTWGSRSGLGNQLETWLGSARSLARAQLVYRFGTRDSGIGLACLGAQLGLSGS